MQIKLFGKTLTFGATAHVDSIPEQEKDTPPVQAMGGYGPGYNNFHTHSFTGEKNPGELGPAKTYCLDHEYLRAKSWQLYLDSEICQLLFERMGIWVIGEGLRLKSEPNEDILEQEGLSLDRRKFKNITESRFDIYSQSDTSTYSGMGSINDLAATAELNAMVAGDVLVVLRVIEGQVKTELIDGAHISTPPAFGISGRAENGNIVKHGVELDATGQHVAFYVRKGYLDFERVEARSKSTGLIMAWLYYGLKYRIDNVRGMPLITAIMETASKLDRYKEAAVGSAEERAKMAIMIEHDVTSDGEDPFGGKMAKSMGNMNTPHTESGEALANRVAATTNKQAVNLPIGAKATTLDSKNELYFEPFYGVNLMILCATVGIPKDVALMLYTSNYSASRAAIKDWEHTITVKRSKADKKLYRRIYMVWLHTQILANKIPAPGYLVAMNNSDPITREAYTNCRFVGASVPHIDPEKEVRAIRAKLGSLATHIPLTTLEEATEALNGGSVWDNLERFAHELEEATKAGLKVEPEEVITEKIPED